MNKTPSERLVIMTKHPRWGHSLYWLDTGLPVSKDNPSWIHPTDLLLLQEQIRLGTLPKKTFKRKYK